jgi:hypothetical protein
MSLARLLVYPAIAASLVFVVPACSAGSADDPGAESGQEQDLRKFSHCGGITGATCSGSLTCVDDPIDSCDPATGGKDCPGICVNVATAPRCGGIAGLACADGLTCVDNPTDGCNPASGADCGGICVQASCDPKLALTANCPRGTSFDTAKCACAPPSSHPTCATLHCVSGYHCAEKTGALPACVKDTPTDCRTTGCSSTKTCSGCWHGYACMPKGARC